MRFSLFDFLRPAWDVVRPITFGRKPFSVRFILPLGGETSEVLGCSLLSIWLLSVLPVFIDLFPSSLAKCNIFSYLAPASTKLYS
jgi:hypothetical protein